MCGIAGLVNWGTEEDLSRMVDALAHRGPDDSGTRTFVARNGDWIGLGSRRLAILDLSPNGHMPMSNPDGSLTITYNGEIYNFLSLREMLQSKGYVFRSTTDTEVVLSLYQEFGPDCVRLLNGMFAFVVWDQPRQQLFMARDHLGIKPLYYSHDGKRLALASEAKSLVRLPDISRSLNQRAIREYLSFQYLPEPSTMFERVQKLPAGHYAVFKDGSLSTTRYWDLRFPSQAGDQYVDRDALVEELRDHFFAAVRSQTISDVPIGTFLSAGLDSSSILAALSSGTSGLVSTFTVTFPEEHRRGETLDDATVARRTAEHFGAEHIELVVQPDIEEILPKVMGFLDEPTADSAVVAAYAVNRAASEHAKVMLSGIGGDELFAGYRKYKSYEIFRAYQRLPKAIRQHFLQPLVNRVPDMHGFPWRERIRLLKKTAGSAGLPFGQGFTSLGLFMSEAEQRALLLCPLFRNASDYDPLDQHCALFERAAQADFLHQMLYVDTHSFLAHNLTYNDRMSMATSMEVRVPFLDRELVEWVAGNVPSRFKLEGNTTKAILRKAMSGIVPDEVLRQPKRGFGTPISKWLSADLREMVDDLLSHERVSRRGLFHPQTVTRYVNEQRAGNRDKSQQVWSLLALELWMQAYMDEPTRGN